MGQTNSVPSYNKRKKSFRHFHRRSSSHQNNLSATFTINEPEQKIEQLNINLASEEELMTLPGITRTIAQSIVEHRKLIGRFKRVEDLALVCGVGAEKLAKIRPEICVGRKNPCSSRAQSLDSLSTDNCNKVYDINKSSVFDLQNIHGISQELAASIVHYREKKGLFKSVDNLLKVKGMDAIRLGAIRCYLTVDSNQLNHSNSCVLNTQYQSQPSHQLPNISTYTPKHRKSLSAPTKLSMCLIQPPINDIFELLSAYSHRPIIEEEFKYERNGNKAIRIATWNLDRLCLQKAENLGFREVVCRTILENKFSLITIQDVENITALKLLCDEMNNPTLRRVIDFQENSRCWYYRVGGVPPPGSHNTHNTVAYLYDGDVGIHWVGLVNSNFTSATVAKFLIGSNEQMPLTVVNLQAKKEDDFKQIAQFDDQQGFVVIMGDFTEFGKNIGHFPVELTIETTFLNIIPLSTNTASLSTHYNNYNNHNNHNNDFQQQYRNCSNILVNGAAVSHLYTGRSGVIRQGLSHLAIPRGWTWGGVASENCPVWCELFVVSSTSLNVNVSANTSTSVVSINQSNGHLKNVDQIHIDSHYNNNNKVINKVTKTKESKRNSNSSISNGNCLQKGI